jgi:hypothetical protein
MTAIKDMFRVDEYWDGKCSVHQCIGGRRWPKWTLIQQCANKKEAEALIIALSNRQDKIRNVSYYDDHGCEDLSW